MPIILSICCLCISSWLQPCSGPAAAVHTHPGPGRPGDLLAHGLPSVRCASGKTVGNGRNQPEPKELLEVLLVISRTSLLLFVVVVFVQQGGVPVSYPQSKLVNQIGGEGGYCCVVAPPSHHSSSCHPPSCANLSGPAWSSQY